MVTLAANLRLQATRRKRRAPEAGRYAALMSDVRTSAIDPKRPFGLEDIAAQGVLWQTKAYTTQALRVVVAPRLGGRALT